MNDKEIVCSNCGMFVSEGSSDVSSRFNQQGRLQISTAKTLGIVSIIIGLLGIPLLGWIFGANGLSKAKSWTYSNDPSLLYEARKAKRLNEAGIAVSTIVFVAYFVILMMLSFAPYAIFGAI